MLFIPDTIETLPVVRRSKIQTHKASERENAERFYQIFITLNFCNAWYSHSENVSKFVMEKKCMLI